MLHAVDYVANDLEDEDGSENDEDVIQEEWMRIAGLTISKTNNEMNIDLDIDSSHAWEKNSTYSYEEVFSVST